jgi:Flp pilus assembly protein TadD
MTLHPREADRFNAVYKRAWALAKPEMKLGDRPHSQRPGWLGRWRLHKALRLFDECLRADPSNWPTLWAMGKVHQRLGAPTESLACFAKAHDLQPTNADVAREAGIAACEAGRFADSVQYNEAALRLLPNDAGLMSNLGLAQLLNGDVHTGIQTLEAAQAVAPRDGIINGLLRRARDVGDGARPHPRSVSEFMAR